MLVEDIWGRLFEKKSIREGFVGSSFFITLNRIEELERANTVFGRIIDLTVYNLAAFESTPLTSKNRPKEPIKIKSITVFSHLFNFGISISNPKKIEEKKEESKPNQFGRKVNRFQISLTDKTEPTLNKKIKSLHSTLFNEKKIVSFNDLHTFEFQKVTENVQNKQFEPQINFSEAEFKENIENKDCSSDESVNQMAKNQIINLKAHIKKLRNRKSDLKVK